MTLFKQFIQKYAPLGLDTNVLQYMFNSADEIEKKRMLEDDGYLFDKYQAVM